MRWFPLTILLAAPLQAQGLDIAVDAEFHPLQPDGLIQLTVEVLAVLLDEVVGAEYLGTLDVLGKVEVVLEVAPHGHGQEVHVGHDIPLAHTLGPNRGSRGL